MPVTRGSGEMSSCTVSVATQPTPNITFTHTSPPWSVSAMVFVVSPVLHRYCALGSLASSTNGVLPSQNAVSLPRLTCGGPTTTIIGLEFVTHTLLLTEAV